MQRPATDWLMPSSLRRDLAAAAILAALVLGIFAVTWQRTSARSWNLPTRYGGDDVYSLALLRAARDGHVSPLAPLRVPELGAPGVANWDGFLRQHKPQYLLAGALARAVPLFVVGNLLLLGVHVLAALSLFAAARFLGARREWAMAGALLFAFSRFMYFRGLGHLTIAACWPIPLALVTLACCTSRRPLQFRSRRFVAALAFTVLVGLHNIYFAALDAQFLVLAGLARVTRLGRWRELRLPLLLTSVLLGTVVFDNANQIVDRMRGGPGPASLVRPYGDLQILALKPMELFVPTQGTGLFVPQGLKLSYWSGILYRGEMGSAYLGIAGVAALIWLLGRGLAGVYRARRSGALLPLLAIGYVLLFSSVGGLNGLLGALGFTWLRAANRYSVWILAITLLTATTALGRVRRLADRRASTLLAAAVVVVGLFDQVPSRAQRASDLGAVRGAVESDHAFVAAVEAMLPRGGAVFSEPAIDFPESARRFEAEDYEPLRPYLHSTRLRFSYGTDKNRPGATWAKQTDELPLRERTSRLEALGFSGMLVTTRALPDGGQALLDELSGLGYRQIVRSADGHFVFVAIGSAR